jgi:CheY-like chemotaxis protein
MVYLVLIDIVMPFMTGVELTERVRQRDPALPVILMSGYSGDEMLQRGLRLSGAPFLQKPVTPESLAGAVRDRIDRSAASVHVLS